MAATVIQHFVVPVCTYADDDKDSRELKKLIGTAFFVGAGGYFLTARHVLEQAFATAKRDATEVGLVVKSDNTMEALNLVVKLQHFEFAPKPYDIAAGWVPYRATPTLVTKPKQVMVWDDVYSAGYPVSASLMKGPALWMNVRGYRGHIQRPTTPEDMPLGVHPPGFELSFLIGPGASGGPVFTMPDQTLIGVAVASYKTEVVDDEILEVNDKGEQYTEKRLRIEQFGFAHDLQGLLGWKARLFEGRTLQEVASIGVDPDFE